MARAKSTPHTIRMIRDAFCDSLGYAIVRNAVPEPQLLVLEKAIEMHCSHGATIRRGTDVYGIRNLLDVAGVCALARSPELRSVVAPVLGPESGAVRGIFFDKTPGANWSLRWHRDWSIAVCARVDVPGYGCWSQKAGIQHVRPPAEILENMLTVRLHLDACDASNGALKVIPGSHRRLDVGDAALSNLALQSEVALCAVDRGDVVLMRPLIAHSSDKGTAPRRRRVIHIEYAARALPPPLAWHTYIR